MGTNAASESDLQFQRAFEAGCIQPSEFNHAAHLRLSVQGSAFHQALASHFAGKQDQATLSLLAVRGSAQ